MTPCNPPIPAAGATSISDTSARKTAHAAAASATARQSPARTSAACTSAPKRSRSSPRPLQKQAAAELARLGAAPVSAPLTELARLAGQAIAWKDTMGAKVNELSGGIRYQGGQGTEQLRAEIALFERAMDRCSAVLVAMARLDIDDRLAGIREKTADMLERALDAALEASGTPLEGKAKARATFRRNLVILPAPEDPAS